MLKGQLRRLQIKRAVALSTEPVATFEAVISGIRYLFPYVSLLTQRVYSRVYFRVGSGPFKTRELSFSFDWSTTG
jgi:hypothetical protein